jgi:iron(III) transport system substrate-binding protein
MKSRTKIVAVGAAAVLAVLTACGSSGTTASTSSPAAGSAASGSSAAGASGSAASSADWDSVVAAANAEGKVTMYSSQNPTNLDALKAGFEEAYPDITLEYVRGVDADGATKVQAEKDTGAGTGDVYVTASMGWITDTGEPGGFAVPVTGPAFDNPAYDAAKSVIDDKFFLIGAAVLGMGWNTELFPQGLKTYDDLINPELDGKIGITKPTSGAYTDFYAFVIKQTGVDFMKDLAALNPKIYPGTLPISQALTSGELAAALVVQPLIAEKESGAPVDWVLPDPAWGARWNAMVLSAAPNPNAAQVLANYMVTPEGQEAMSAGYGAALPDVPGSTANAQEVAQQDPALQTPEAVAAYLTEWQALFEG